VTEAHLGLAMVASRKSEWAVAKTEFLWLSKANDRDATSHLNVARACLELGEMPCALEHGEAAKRLRGKEENVLFTVGTIYLAAGKSPEAKASFQQICDLIPGAASCPYGLALVAAKAGDKETALAELGKAVDRKLPNPERVAKDKGFESVREDPRFQALAAKAAQAGK
jgi:tetratricopeptide (TPR) repeat protein